jgi:O-acetyl-ADP-ribose deacetylase (regulator of RNase III)
MIHDVEGDILLSNAQAIAHGVSPNEHFDVGLALALREQWPSMAKDFRHYANQTRPNPGELWVYHSAEQRVIYNLLTQDGEHTHGAQPGRATLSNVQHALRRLRHELEVRPVRSLALPRLATGAGHLAWSDVRPLIVEQLGDLSIPVFVYATYHHGKHAVETGA